MKKKGEKTWECGETITADALNHIEQGIADSGGGGAEPLIVHVEYHEDDPGVKFLDKTFGEIRQAFESGKCVLIQSSSTNEYGTLFSSDNAYAVQYSLGTDTYLGAQGQINTIAGSYSVDGQAPYTLAALDAEYPYMAS